MSFGVVTKTFISGHMREQIFTISVNLRTPRGAGLGGKLSVDMKSTSSERNDVVIGRSLYLT